MLTKDNFKQTIFEYAQEKYGNKFEEFYNNFYDEFPDKDCDFGDDELYFKNFYDWMIIEKPLPETNKTIVEEFIEDNPNIPEELKICMKKMKNMVRGEFIVISVTDTNVILEKQDTNEQFNVKFYENMDKDLFDEGNKIIGRIHEFDEFYRFCGAFNVIKKPKIPDFFFQDTRKMLDWFEKKQIKNIQSKILTNDKLITVMLKNYPSGWIDSMCREFGVEARRKEEKIKLISKKLQEDTNKVIKDLSEDSKCILKLILNGGGFIKYSKLRKFDDEMDFFWFEHGIPKSSIGALIGRGLIFIGKIPYLNGKLYKSALIPLEIREKLKRLLFNGKQKQIE